MCWLVLSVLSFISVIKRKTQRERLLDVEKHWTEKVLRAFSDSSENVILIKVNNMLFPCRKIYNDTKTVSRKASIFRQDKALNYGWNVNRTPHAIVNSNRFYSANLFLFRQKKYW